MRFYLLLPAFYLTGCGSYVSSFESGIALPTAFTAPSTDDSPSATGWIHDIADPELTALVGEAMAQNNDLTATVARLRSARANLEVVGAAQLPQLSPSGDGSRRK